MIQTPKDCFEEWLNAPLGRECDDPRFEVRRATPDDYERIWDTVDRAFERKRPRPVYDWLYRRNPFGLARCWITTERASGDLVKVGADFPWPIWRDREPLRGKLGGDAATVPEWQRKGLSHVRRPVTRSHPWHGKSASIAGPNEGSRAVSHSAKRSETLLGFLPGGVRPLRAARLAGRAGLPEPLSRVAGAPADALFAAWQRIVLGAAREASGRVEPVSRFDVEFDAVTLRTMSFPLYWCPHNADFLNWRYLDHPGETYVGFALVEAERPTGYAVVRLAGDDATLAELAAPSGPPAARLLQHVLDVAREAGCGWLGFFATPSFPHWRLLRRAGFLPYRTNNFFEGGGRQWEPEIARMESWQAGPGDRDYH